MRYLFSQWPRTARYSTTLDLSCHPQPDIPHAPCPTSWHLKTSKRRNSNLFLAGCSTQIQTRYDGELYVRRGMRSPLGSVPLVFKSGNWICAGDGAFNFATDASCIKCQASKSDAAVYEPPKSKLTWRYRSNDKDCTTELPEFTMVLFPYGNPSHERLQDELRLIEGYLRRAHARAFHLNLRPTRLITVVSMYHALRVNGGGDPRPHSSIKLWDEQSFTGTRQVPRVYAHLYAADDDLSKGYISNQATKVVWSEKWTGTYVERIKAALNNPRGTLVEGFFRPHTLPNASAYPINDGLDRLDPQNSVEVTTLRYLRKEVQFKIKAELSKRNCDPKLVATYKARIKQIDMALQGHGWIPATEPNYDLNGLI